MAAKGRPRRPFPVDEAARIQRPTREHAVEFAQAMFVRGERVDMQALAAALDVGRSTLYGWVGNREQLIGEALVGLSLPAWKITEEAPGEGIERALRMIRRFMKVTAEYEPLRRFAEREPGPALRVLLAPEGPIHRDLHTGFTRILEANLRAPADPEIVDIIVQLATALQWAPIVAGEPPAIDRAVDLTRRLLETSADTTGAPRPARS